MPPWGRPFACRWSTSHCSRRSPRHGVSRWWWHKTQCKRKLQEHALGYPEEFNEWPLGRSLYESLRVLGGHFETLGVKLKSSLDAYNQAVGSLEGNVLSKARKFKELQAANGGEEIKVIEPVDRAPRLLNAPELTGGLPFRASSVEDVDAAEGVEEVEHV